MDVNELIEAKKERPFEPFRLVMSDGNAYDVTDPHMLMIGERTTHLYFPSPANPDVVQYSIRLSNDHMSTTYPLQAVAEIESQDPDE